jgi:serine/threonine protein kinase
VTACPSDDELLDYVGRTLVAPRRAAVELHLAACAMCPAVVAAAANELHGGAVDPATAEGRPDVSALQPGDKLGRYEIVELLGRGGMGVVYGAHDPRLDRRVALKLLRPDRRIAALEDRFVREGQAMARLSHANIVALHDVGVIDGGIFLAMEYVEGGTLGAWLAAAPRPWREVLAAYLEAGRGLAAAHRAGIVHRDFKPDNVLVARDGRVRVTDFGLARLGDPLPGHRRISTTAPGSLLGTPAFMAPEQLRGDTATAAADQFAFASAVYQALVGQSPFAGGDFDTLRAAVLAGRYRVPPCSSIPAHIHVALRRALEREPAARYPDMDELLVALVTDPLRRTTVVA